MDVDRLKEELADVFIYSLLLADNHNFDIKEIVLSKLEINRKKYPVQKSKGKADKYTDI